MLRKIAKWETIVKLFLLLFFAAIVFEVYFLSKTQSKEVEEDQYSLTIEENERPLEWLTNATPTTGHWQPVAGTRFKFYVFSAHYDRRLKSQLRIIGATRPGGDLVVCQVFPTGNTSHYFYVPATVKPFDGQAKVPFTAVSITCPIPPESTAPWAVSVVSTTLPHVSNLLSVQGATSDHLQHASSVIACVEPIDNFYSQPMRLIEFIEMNTLLGVNHFMIYNESASPEVSCLLQHYAQQGRVTMLPWRFDRWSKALKKNYHIQGKLAAANDCLQRSRNFEYAILLDTDQFIVPKNTNTLLEFINSKRKIIDLNQTGAFFISNVNFYQDWPDHEMDKTLNHYMMTVLKTQRTEPNCADSPSIAALVCRPNSTLGVNEYYHPDLIPGQEIQKTDQLEILSHLYVSCSSSSVNCTAVPSVLDTSLHRFTDKLILAMQSTWNQAMPTCSLQDLNASIHYNRVICTVSEPSRSHLTHWTMTSGEWKHTIPTTRV